MHILQMQPPDFAGGQRLQVTGCNKLQAQKSSFQAWKCVSFGCSLLALVLLLSKWYEVTTDLQLLAGVDRLLALNQQASNQSAAGSGPGASLSWPPVPLEQLLPSANETNFGMESMSSNGSMLMSHMQMNLNRELNGDQLLKQEVDMFIVEFRNAKSTLSLSCLLVIVYLLSWILMTLAINDARISNDISLRNILLLSTFGAIDIAASVGFVMVRVIMYNVKNKPFASDLLASAGLRDSPVRLSADQLTAFTALRLISMRSGAAYMDIYVSFIVALLTILRLYAILRALTYYRRLRASSDSQRVAHLSSVLSESHRDNGQLATGSIRSEKALWGSPSRGFYASGRRFRLGSAAARRRIPKPTGNHQFVSNLPMSHQYQQAGPLSLDTGAGLMFATSGEQQPLEVARRKPAASPLLAATMGRPAGAKNLYLVPGKPAGLSKTLSRAAGSALKHQKASAGELLLLSPPAGLLEARSDSSQEDLFALRHESSEQNLINLEQRKESPPVRETYNTVRSNGTTYTLLTAEQLSKIGKKMSLGGGANNGGSTRRKLAREPRPSQAQTRYKLLNLGKQHSFRTTPRGSKRTGSTGSGPRNDSGLAGGEELDEKELAWSLSNCTLGSREERAQEDSDASGELRQTSARAQRRRRQQQQVADRQDEVGDFALDRILQLQEESQQQQQQQQQLHHKARQKQLGQYYYA